MPRDYVAAPTDPAYYDALASTTGQGVISAIQGVAGSALGAVSQSMQTSQRNKATREQIIQLRDALVSKGMSQEEANAAAVDYVKTGKMTVLDSLQNIDKAAAEIAASKATTAGKLFETDAARQKLPGELEQQGADLESTQGLTAYRSAQTADIPASRATENRGMAVEERGMGVEESLATGQLDRETREFVKSFDRDLSGTIDDAEKEKMIRTKRATIREQVRKAKMDTGLNQSPEVKRFKAMTDADIDEEAITQTKQEISDYEFARDNVGRLDGGGGGNTETDKAISLLSEAIQGGATLTPDKIRQIVSTKFPGADIGAILMKWQELTGAGR